MYVGAQRVEDRSITLYLYLHVGLIGDGEGDLLRDVRWVSAAAPGLLAREQHAGRQGGRRILSYLEVSGPDETTSGTLREVLDRLAEHVASGERSPLTVEAHGTQFFCHAEMDDSETELGALRRALEAFFADGTEPPTRRLTIEVQRRGAQHRFRWSEESCQTLRSAAHDWSPTSLGIDDDVRGAFQQQHGALYPHVLGIIKPDVDLDALGGVQFVEVASGRVLWFSPHSRAGGE